ncbi:hypothetical protein YN1HA_3590 [Sulfurisphaera ohwakuensis]
MTKNLRFPNYRLLQPLSKLTLNYFNLTFDLIGKLRVSEIINRISY